MMGSGVVEGCCEGGVMKLLALADYGAMIAGGICIAVGDWKSAAMFYVLSVMAAGIRNGEANR